jgi:hypothetical protein
MTMSQELWSSLEAIEESINKIVCLQQVLKLYPIINEEVVEVLEALVLDFSDNQKEVWNQVQKVCTKNDELIEQLNKYKSINDEHIALEKRYDELCEKYDNLAYYDSYRGDSGTMNVTNYSGSSNTDTIYINGAETQEENFYNVQD